jgi:hypothetical protein
MIVLIDCGEDMLFVPTWMITKSTNLKFVLPEKTNSKSLPMVAPGKTVNKVNKVNFELRKLCKRKYFLFVIYKFIQKLFI